MITIEVLQKLNACPEGQAWFAHRYPTGLALSDWTQEEQVAALRDGGGRWLMWGYIYGLLPWWMMSSANLSSVDLYGASLSGADLSRANLSSANLSRANLSRANLSRANLSRANLSSANLSSVDLYGANLSSANLSGASLSGAKWDEYTIWPAGFVPPEEDRCD